MLHTVVFTPEAESQLTELYRYIAQAASPDVAQRYLEAIVTYCESLQSFPHRGSQRDDIRPGLRVTNYKGRCVVAFAVTYKLVSVVGVFYGGQDFETVLQWDING